MSGTVLLRDDKRYDGKYVAIRSFRDKRVISSGTDISRVINKARKKGVKDPIVFFVPKKGMVYIY